MCTCNHHAHTLYMYVFVYAHMHIFVYVVLFKYVCGVCAGGVYCACACVLLYSVLMSVVGKEVVGL